MAHNRYFIIDANDPNISEIYAVIVGTPESQRYSIDRSQIVVKLHEGDHSEYEFLHHYEEMNHDTVLNFLNSPEWTSIFVQL